MIVHYSNLFQYFFIDLLWSLLYCNDEMKQQESI